MLSASDAPCSSLYSSKLRKIGFFDSHENLDLLTCIGQITHWSTWYVTQIGKESQSGVSRLSKEGSSIVRAGKYFPPTLKSLHPTPYMLHLRTCAMLSASEAPCSSLCSLPYSLNSIDSLYRGTSLIRKCIS